jgi:hypothetical protein
MEQLGLIANKLGDGVIGRFTKDGEILFKEKAQSVLYLGA